MFCSNCGARIGDGVGSCTKCGAKVESFGKNEHDVVDELGIGSPSNMSCDDVAAEAHGNRGSAKPKRGFRRVGRLVVACLVLVLAIGGTALADVFRGLSGGIQTLSIENGKNNARSFPRATDGGGSKTGSGTASLNVEGEPGADVLFLEKLEELLGQYGEPCIRGEEIELVDGTQYLGYIGGLAYATLADFGDGAECLAVVYQSDDGMPYERTPIGERHVVNYVFEVWEYDKKSETIRKISGTVDRDLLFAARTIDSLVTNADIGLWDSSSGTPIMCISACCSDGTNEAASVGLLENGDVGLIHTTKSYGDVLEEGEVEWHYFVDAEETSEDAWQSANEEVGITPDRKNAGTVYLTYNYPSMEEALRGEAPKKEAKKREMYPAETCKMVDNTLNELRRRVNR